MGEKWDNLKRRFGIGGKYDQQGDGQPGDFDAHEQFDPYTGPRGSARPHVRSTPLGGNRWEVRVDRENYGEIWRRPVETDQGAYLGEKFFARVYRTGPRRIINLPDGDYFDTLADANRWCNRQLNRDEQEPR